MFPTVKVAGGVDLAGDAYTGSNAPVPDANPMDCNGHGSHVSGSAAGYGVTAAGATFPGPYDASSSTYSGLRIGPGTAPQATLFGIRVFGCTGSTGLSVQGIDWAMDPDGDLDLSDHLDVINMSLGSQYGAALTASSIAADNAAAAGVIVVTSAGNSGDTFFIAGSPGVASRAIATAASVDDGETAPFVQVNAPAGIAGNYLAGAAQFGPAPMASGTPPGPHNVVIGLDPADGSGPLTTDACSALTNAGAVAGNFALVDRGTCAFTIKVKNCQDAGAVGVIIADNAGGNPPGGMSGADATITIPSVRVTLADGNTLKANIATLNVTLFGPDAGDTLASFSSRGPRRIYGSPVRLKPDIAAPGLNITSVQTGHTCTTPTGCTGLSDPSGYQAGNQTLTISGTSMASPHMAGVMALLREIHPDWQVEELKALAMNYATHDVSLVADGAPKFGPSRIGAGRVDPAQSAVGSVVAMNAEDVGVVSVTFDPEVQGVVTRSKKVRVVNHGATAQTYTLGIQTILDAPGVAFSLPGGSSITVGAGQTEEFTVQMSADASQMKHARDASLFPLQYVQANYGDQARNFLAEEGGYVTFSQGATLKFRLPVYMAERPASTMSAPPLIATGGAGTGSTTIPLSGTGLCTGTLAAGPTCLGSWPLDVESLVSPFELQVVSPLDPTRSTDYADIQYVGVAYYQAGGSLSVSNDLIMFGVSSWGDWSTPNDVTYDVCVDNNNDGFYDKIVYNSNPSIFVSGASPNDNFVRIIRDTVTNGNTILGLGSPVNLVGPDVVDSALHLNNVMILAATPSQLGIGSTATTTIRYKVVTCPGSNPGCARTTTGNRCNPSSNVYYDQAAGPYFYDWANQGLNFGGDFLDEDLNGKAIPVTWNTANMATNGSLGALLLHHQNASGTRAEVVLLEGTPQANLAIANSASVPSPNHGTNVTFTITVTNNGPDPVSGVVVYDYLPDGLEWSSDTGGGAYDPSTGFWTVPGSITNGGNASIQITATVSLSGQICNMAQIVSGTPLDPSPADNQATVCINVPRTADLAIVTSANTPTILAGGSVAYTVTVTNYGDDPAYGLNTTQVFVPANVPPGNYSGVTASQGVFDSSTGLWNVASLGAGATATLQFSITAPNMAGILTSSVSTLSTKSGRLRSMAFDPNNADNSASFDLQVLSPANVSATKTVSGDFHEGGTVTYTVVLSNSSDYRSAEQSGARADRCAASTGHPGEYDGELRDRGRDGGNQYRDLGWCRAGSRLGHRDHDRDDPGPYGRTDRGQSGHHQL